MYLVSSENIRPIESTRELHDYFLSACKPREEWRVGTEFEVIGVRMSDPAHPPAYEGEESIGALLERLIKNGWSAVRESAGNIIALVRGQEQVTFEPGGQLELAARPVVHGDDLAADLSRYFGELCGIAPFFGLAWMGMGFRPFGRREDVPWMPKERYKVMRAYLPTRGSLGLEMMQRTATVQVNLDYGDPDDAAEKLRAVMSVTSILTAIFASSPIVNDVDSGYQSYRSRVWLDTDPDRCGLLGFAFADGDVFAAYTEWALDVPMFFVYRDGYQPAGGMTFRRFMRDGFHGEHATMEDWGLHLSTLFPEARLKRFLEVRGCDSGNRRMILALGPLCRGFLYDDAARRAAIELTGALDMSERLALAEAVTRQGMAAEVGATGHRVLDLARELVAIAADGLSRSMPGELRYLDAVRAIVDSGRTQADELRDLWQRSGGDRMALVDATAFRCG